MRRSSKMKLGTTKTNTSEKDNHEDEVDMDDLPVNRIDLVFSKENTNENDRKKVEYFWKYFAENHEIGLRLLKGSMPTTFESSEVLEPKSSEENTRLFGSVNYGNHIQGNKIALEALALLKSKHLDQVALANAKKDKKVEGSPRYADEIIEDNLKTIIKDINKFENMASRRKESSIKDSSLGRAKRQTVVTPSEWSSIYSSD